MAPLLTAVPTRLLFSPLQLLNLSSRHPMRGTMPAKLPTYALVTPARNEAAFIEKSLSSVASQTTLPFKWVIVSDGSTDGTDEMVRAFAAKHEWVEFVRLPDGAHRDFAGKV